MCSVIILCFVCVSQTDAIVLDNGLIRVEIDPLLFSVRYLGPPGGPNFVEELFVDNDTRQGLTTASPGGITTEVFPFDSEDPALARGPAEVIDRRPHFVALLGAVSENSKIRIKKEFQLDPLAPRITYTVSALSLIHRPREMAIVNVVQLPSPTVLEVARNGDEFVRDGGSESVTFLTINPKPTAISREPGFWRGALGTVVHVLPDARWMRETKDKIPLGSSFHGGYPFYCILQDDIHTHSANFQTPLLMVDASSPATLTEVWTLFPGDNETGRLREESTRGDEADAE